MIWGTLNREHGHSVNKDWIRNILTSPGFIPDTRQIYTDDQVAFSCHVPFKTPGYRTLKPVEWTDGNLASVFTGRIYNSDELQKTMGFAIDSPDNGNPAFLILHLYKQVGTDFVQKLDGDFAFAIWDRAEKKLILYRDRIGIEPLYYYAGAHKFIFSSSIPLIFRHPEVRKELNLKAIGKFLLFNYNPGLETVFEKIHKLRPAHFLVVNGHDVKISRYWKLSFHKIIRNSEQEIAQKLLKHLRCAVTSRMDSDQAPGIFLSGGMDSSTVLALASETAGSPLNTFSYRCTGESFDESHYARLMARNSRANHHEIEYSSHDVLSMPEIVKAMNEPFCDVGINIATHILGKKASQRLSYVLTGDGGDELFGGHPVYEADKIAQFLDPIPNLLKSPFLALLSCLPDSEKKKNLIVKAKRFSESLKLPGELLSHRWRVYYRADELKQLLGPSFASEVIQYDLFEDIIQFNHEADGPDLLSNALYSDYQTAVDFYLRRNDLNRSFWLETRFPLLDHRLIEFCATIPSPMKIKGWFDTKYIFKKAMAGVLPHDILYRKDKLGHSIPLKNWIRCDKGVKQFLLGFIAENNLEKRGLFQQSYMHKLIQDHMAKKRNNSHRLWALAVLEMWLQEHYDR